MIEVVAIILACMATGAGVYAFYLSIKLKNSEIQIIGLKAENEKLKNVVMPKQPPVLIKQGIKR